MLKNAIAHFSERHCKLDLAVELIFEAPCSPPAADRESSKCKEVIPFYCSALAIPVRLWRTTGNALAGAFSRSNLQGGE
jgi:hypothetical protein